MRSSFKAFTLSFCSLFLLFGKSLEGPSLYEQQMIDGANPNLSWQRRLQKQAFANGNFEGYYSVETHPSNVECYEVEAHYECCPIQSCQCNYELPTLLRTTFKSTVGEGLGYSSYNSFGFMLFSDSLCEQRFQPFVVGNYHYFKKGDWATNIGVGLRFETNNCNIFGINFFYDFLKDHHHFNQVGAGFEFLGNCFDFRINGYFPVGNKSKFEVETFNFLGDYYATLYEEREALTGGDFEFGTYLKSFMPICSLQPYLALGSYYYHDTTDNDIAGGKVRLAFNYLDYFEIEVKSTYDNVYGANVQGVFSINLAWSCFGIDTCRSGARHPLRQKVQRQDIIVLSKERCCWDTNF